MIKSSKDKKEIYLGRRDFIKTTAMAVLGSALSCAGLKAKENEIQPKPVLAGTIKRNNTLLCLSSSPSGYNKLVSMIESTPEIDFRVTSVQVNYLDPSSVMEAVKGKEAAVLLACLPSRTFCFGKLSQSMGELDIPMIVYSPNTDLIMIDANFAAELRTKGADVKFAKSEAEVIGFLKKAASPRLLEGKKAIVYGRPFDSTTVPALNLTEDYIYKHTGVSIQHRPLDDLRVQLKDIGKESAAAEMERWKKEAAKIDRVSEKVLMDQCRMYVLLRSIIEKEGLSAISMDCLSYSFTPSPMMPLPCLAFARLRDEGFTAGCEADIYGMLTSMVFEKICGRSSFFANVASVDEKRSTTTLRHCIAPLKMHGPDSPQLTYKLDNYHGLGTALVPKVNFPIGEEVTLGSYTKDLKNFVLWSGKTCASDDDTDIPFASNFHVHKYCSNMVEVVVGDFDRFFQNIANLHHIMVMGNYTKKIADAMSAENVKLIGPVVSNA